MYENNDDEWKLPNSSGGHVYDCIAFKSDVFVVHYYWHCRNENSLTYNTAGKLGIKLSSPFFHQWETCHPLFELQGVPSP